MSDCVFFYECSISNGFFFISNEPISGFADDYAFVIRGLLDLYEASGNVAWLEWANQLQDKQDDLFWDPKDSGYFSMAQDQNILLRLKEGEKLKMFIILNKDA